MLEGFHVKATWQMTTVNRPERQPDGTWLYPATEDVLEEVSLQTIANWIVDRPIFKFCEEAERLCRSMPRQFWWEQPFNLDVARAFAGANVAANDELEVDDA
eukprot:1938890-Ditylum_brightwellii.AAC.1